MADGRASVALRQAVPIALDVAFTCAPGEVLAIFGPSGSGKTTILRSIAGLYTPADAVVRVGDRTWTDTRAGVYEPPHRRSVGYVFQEYALFPHLSAAGNVMTALGHRPRRERRSRAAELLALVHLGDAAARRPHELSGGERQRVALARALAREPALLLLDEPFAAVDRAVRRGLQGQIDEIRRAFSIPILLVTHDFGDVVRLATTLLLVDGGRALAFGALSDLTSRPELPWLGDALGRGSVFDAHVTGAPSGARGLAALTFDGGSLVVPGRTLGPAARVRVRIPAREVILATHPPEGLSLHNVLRGIVSSVVVERGAESAVVQLTVGRERLLAEVTPDAVDRLSIAPGRDLFALIKSMSVDVTPTG